MSSLEKRHQNSVANEWASAVDRSTPEVFNHATEDIIGAIKDSGMGSEDLKYSTEDCLDIEYTLFGGLGKWRQIVDDSLRFKFANSLSAIL